MALGKNRPDKQDKRNKLLNPYATGGLFCQYKMMQKGEDVSETLASWYSLWVLRKSYLMNRKMIGFRKFSKSLRP